MTTLPLIATIEFALIVFLVIYAWSLGHKVETQKRILANWKTYTGQLEADYNLLYSELSNLRLEYGDQITALKIKHGEITAHQINTYVPDEPKAYVMELPGMPALPDGYRVAMGQSGELVNLYNPTKIKTSKNGKTATPDVKLNVASNGHMNRFDAMSFVVNTLASDIMRVLGRDTLTQDELDLAADCVIRWNSESRDQSSYAVWIAALLTGAIEAPKTSSNHKADRTTQQYIAGRADTGSFAPSSNSSKPNDTRDLFTSDKYGEYIDILMNHLNVKAIPGPKYAYAKNMYKVWESGKKPNTAQEYARRIIDSKFGGK
jgi:hypothetical protein